METKAAKIIEPQNNIEFIRKVLSEIAFSKDEKTSDRLRALDILYSTCDDFNRREEVMEKLDEVLSFLR